MNEDIIKDNPIMTPEELLTSFLQLQGEVKSFMSRYNAGNFGRKIKNDEKTIMSKGRMEIGSKDTIIIMDSEDPTYLLWAGNADKTLAPFRVTRTGGVYLGGVVLGTQYSGAVISGALESGWNTSGWSISSPATGRYTITHNLGHTNYGVQVSALAALTKMCSVEARNTNSFTVRVETNAGVLENNDFFFDLKVKS